MVLNGLGLRGQTLTRFGIRYLLAKHKRQACLQLPLLDQKRIQPHSIRHSTAVHLLKSGVDLSTIANWLGHASVNLTFAIRGVRLSKSQ